MLGETIILDPAEQPLTLTGTTSDHGIYLLEHEYPEPEKVDIRSGSALSTGRKGALNGYGNRVIPVTLRVAEPPTNATVNVNSPGADPSTGARPATGGPLFHAILQQIEQKCERMTRRGGEEGVGGVYKRTLPNGQTILFDVVRAICVVTADRQFLHGRATVRIEFECLPLGYADAETDHGDNVETTLPVLIFEETIDGTAPALGRLVIDEDGAQTQDWVQAALQMRRRDPAASAALFYQAESRTPLGTAALAAGPSGASGAGSNTILEGSLTPNFRAIMSTQAAGGGSRLSHVGRFLVVARVQTPTTNTGAVKVAFEWGQGDLRQFTQNDEVAVYPADDVGGWEGTWRRVFLGTVELDKALVGTQQWEGRLLAKSTVAEDDIYVDTLELWPIGEFYCEVSTALQLSSPTSFAARDEFGQAAGNLAGKTLPVGGVWVAAAGDLDDFIIDTTGKTAQRTAVSDTGSAAFPGRGAIAGTTSFTDVVAQLDAKFSARSAPAGGIIARYIDTNNHLIAYISSSGSGFVTVNLTVAGVAMTLTSQLLAVALDTFYTIRLQVDALGRWSMWFGPQGSTFGSPVISGQHSALATGGALAAGKVGIFDVNQSASAATRNYDNFAAWVPARDAAVFASQSLQLRHDAILREDSAGAIWVPVSKHNGDLLTIPPSGRERQPVRFMVKAQRFDPDYGPDSGIDDISARLFTTDRYLTVPGPL